MPENALDLLTGIKGVGDKLAAEILSVLEGQE
jgi:Holliday junction resolvasome RuvABC DNA-binding subunit